MSSKKGNAPTGGASGPSIIKLTIPAGGASPSPPVGSALGQKGVKAMDFCRQFNDQSKMYTPATPLRCEIKVNSDRTFSFAIRPPATMWMLKRATGVEKASSQKTVARVDARIVYEIAKIKQQDPKLSHMPLKLVFRMIAATARTCGFILVWTSIIQ